MPSVLQEVTLKYASGDEDKRSLLRQTHSVTLTDGIGALPATAMTTCVRGSSVWVTAEPAIGPLMSYVPWVDFTNPTLDTLLGYYSIRGNYEFYWADPGEIYPVLTRDGAVLVTIATVLTVPATASSPTGWPEIIETDVINLASEWLRGMEIAA